MLLQQILTTLDAELDRLSRLRAIVVTLGESPGLVIGTEEIESVAAVPAAMAVMAAEAEPEPARPRRLRRAQVRAARPATDRRAQVVRDHGALRAAVPAGPVVVSRAALVREREARAAAQMEMSQMNAAVPEAGSLGAMIRALRAGSAGIAS